MRGALRAALLSPAFDPVRDIGPSLLAYWDANIGSTITESGGAVSSWRDIKNGYNLAQASGSLQPIYSLTSFGGRPGIYADGTDDYLRMASMPFPVGGGFEIWSLCDQTELGGNAGARSLFAIGDNSNFTAVRMGRIATASQNRPQTNVGNGSTTTPVNDTSLLLSGRVVYRVIVGTAATTPVIDGVIGAPTSVVPGLTATNTTMFAGNATTPSVFWKGGCAAHLVTLPLSGRQTSGLGSWLAGRR